MSIFNSLSPINQLLVLMVTLGIFFLLIVIYLDNNKNFELKRDWRKKKD